MYSLLQGNRAGTDRIKGDRFAGVADPVSGTDNDGDLMLRRVLHGIVGDVSSLCRRGRIKDGNVKERREQPRILLRLRRLRPGIVAGDDDERAFYGLLPSLQEPGECNVQADLLHHADRLMA